AWDAVRFDLEPDTPGFDLVVSYADRSGVLYRDHLGGSYQAVPVESLPARFNHLAAYDLDHDGRTDLAGMLPDGKRQVLLNHGGKLGPGPASQASEYPFAATDAAALADFDGRGRLDLAEIGADGFLHVRHNITPNYGNWLEVALVGVKNLRIAIGSKI